MSACPLCLGEDTFRFFAEGARVYHACRSCELRFLDPASRPSPEAERSRYLLHENDVHDPGYRAFVRPLFDAIRARAPRGAAGLDFGCGSASALEHMLSADGYAMSRFDPFFQPDPEPLARTYDFVAVCEVIEHLFAPHAELERLRALLRPGGWLAVMTSLWSEDLDFARWHYRRDPTHVAFYSGPTFRWIARHLGFAALEIAGERVVLLQRTSR
jgi:SAM-dependent methyltransferase